MNHRFHAVVLAGVLLLATTAAAQWTSPRTVDGQPDLQGVWNYSTLTPLERTAEFEGKAFLSEQEAVEFEKRTLQRLDSDLNREKTERGLVNGTVETADLALAYNQFWWERGTQVVATRRTSLVIDPPDGRIPLLTPKAKTRMAALAEIGQRPARGPEDRPLSERCITRPNAGPPMAPGAYNNYFQLIQIPGYVIIFNEQIHDARIIPMDGRPHLPRQIRQWLGDSRGRWEGNTLIIDTTNFTDKTNFAGSGENMHLIERFTRVGPDALLYEFTVDDPESFTRPWTAQLPMTKTQDPIFEYACHEGNYAMANTLAGARALEKAAEEAAKRK